MVSDELLVGVIGAIVAIIVGVIPLFWAKWNEIRHEIKKIKMEKYDELLKSLTSFMNSPSQQTCVDFVMAFNRSSSYADADVMNKCNEFCKALETATLVRHNRGQATRGFTTLEQTINENTEKISDIFKAIRKDINPRSILSTQKEIDFKVYYAQSL
jgi:hypothetical protein